MNNTDNRRIISCAITGGIHTPSMSEYLPITPEQIAEHSVDAHKAGAAIIHVHARDPKDGRPSPDPELFRQFVSVIREKTDAIINISTGGGAGMPLDDRIAPALELAPEMCTISGGSLNFAVYPLAARPRQWKYDWEKPYLESTKSVIFQNSFAEIEYMINALSSKITRFEFECYDLGHLYNIAHLADRGVIKPPFWIQSVCGVLGGAGSHPEDVVHMRRTANRLFGDSYEWSVLGAGRSQMTVAATAASLGGHIRVGLEDNLYSSKGKLAVSNAEQVETAVSLLASLSLVPASSNEAREILGIG